MKLSIGDKAPQFISKDQNGDTFKLSDLLGKKVVLYFYPNDDTPGCTVQSCNLRDNYQQLLDKGYAVVGVSCNDEKSHQKFIKKYALPFPLVADTDHSVVEAYDVWKEKQMFGNKFMGIVRTTFVLDEKGIITEIFKKIDKENHATQIINA